MNKTLRRLCAFAAAVMLALYCAVAAAAAGKTGSLTVLLSDGDGAAVPDILIRLYRVGEPDGTLTPEFSAADITPDSLLPAGQPPKRRHAGKAGQRPAADRHGDRHRSAGQRLLHRSDRGRLSGALSAGTGHDVPRLSGARPPHRQRQHHL